MKTILASMLCCLSLAAQNPQIKIPDEVRIAFEKEFPNAHNIIWSSDYRNDEDLRYEATFYRSPANYMVSYNKTGEVKALQKSLSPGQLLQTIKSYLKINYPSMKITEATEIITDQKVRTYEVGLVENKKFLVAVFNDNGDFQFMREVKN